jgi:hypothetical protein
MYTVTTKTDRNLRDDHNTKANTLDTLHGDHTLTGDVLWTATMALPAANQQVGDQWLHITAVDGAPVTSRYLAIKDNGIVYSTLTQLPTTGTPPRTHKVISTDTLYSLAKTYQTTVAKIVLDNKAKYPNINQPVGKNPDGFIGKDWELIV